MRSAFESRGGPEATAQLQQIAERYNARAAKERRAIESSIDHMGDGGVDPTLSVAALIVARVNLNSTLWSFKVLVSVKSDFFLIKQKWLITFTSPTRLNISSPTLKNFVRASDLQAGLKKSSL